MRNVPDECTRVQETPHSVIRACIYGDQWPSPWDELTKGPVKALMGMSFMQNIPNQDFLDIWDRQFLSDTLRKEEPNRAVIFMVNARVAQHHAEGLVKLSGTQGCYFELRSSDGRQPHDSQQVVWLPKKSFAEASVAVQTNAQPCALARSGNRYGLRVDHAHAEQTHTQHRPDVIFLHGHELRKFKVGPLPYGSSKMSLAALFRQWNWNARPVGPVGLARDRSGMIWQVQSSTNPEHWIYQVSHGDILISPETAPSIAATPKPTAVIASERTIASLKQPEQPSASNHGTDPWLHHDPWKQQPDVASHQMTAMKESLEKSILQQLRPDTDMHHDVDGRVGELEVKFEQLTCQLNQFQQAQSTHNHATAQQIQTIDNKIEASQQSLNVMLGTKLEAQMAKIEQLFAKRPRHE
eukprot:s267_g16.t1